MILKYFKVCPFEKSPNSNISAQRFKSTQYPKKISISYYCRLRTRRFFYVRYMTGPSYIKPFKAYWLRNAPTV